MQAVSIVVAWELSTLGDSLPDLQRTAIINATDALSFSVEPHPCTGGPWLLGTRILFSQEMPRVFYVLEGLG